MPVAKSHRVEHVIDRFFFLLCSTNLLMSRCCCIFTKPNDRLHSFWSITYTLPSRKQTRIHASQLAELQKHAKTSDTPSIFIFSRGLLLSIYLIVECEHNRVLWARLCTWIHLNFNSFFLFNWEFTFYRTIFSMVFVLVLVLVLFLFGLINLRNSNWKSLNHNSFKLISFCCVFANCLIYSALFII